MRVHVDETWCDDETTRIDLAPGLRAREVADGGDAIAADAHVSGKPRVTGAVHDVSSANNQVERRFLSVQPDEVTGCDRQHHETDAKAFAHEHLQMESLEVKTGLARHYAPG